MRRSIQGVGHMMSTMVLNRKQSVFGGPSLPADAGAAEPLDRNKFEENEDIVVMETKLKILEILQVAGQEHGGVLGTGQESGRAWGAGLGGSGRPQSLVLEAPQWLAVRSGGSQCVALRPVASASPRA